MTTLSRRHNWTETDYQEAVARIVTSADHISGPYFLVEFDGELRAFMEEQGAGTEDLEDDDPKEDNGDWEPEEDERDLVNQERIRSMAAFN